MDYPYTSSSIFPLLSVIQLLGKDISVAEIGAAGGDSTFHALQECPNIKNYYAIEPYCEFEDKITYANLQQQERIQYSLRDQDQQRSVFTHRKKFSSHKNKIHLMEKTSKNAVEYFKDSSLDYIFHDAFPTYEDAIFDFTAWYPKLKKGGIYSGHDFNHPIVQKAVKEFLESNKINVKLLAVEYCWFFIKP